MYVEYLGAICIKRWQERSKSSEEMDEGQNRFYII